MNFPEKLDEEDLTLFLKELKLVGYHVETRFSNAVLIGEIRKAKWDAGRKMFVPQVSYYKKGKMWEQLWQWESD